MGCGGSSEQEVSTMLQDLNIDRSAYPKDVGETVTLNDGRKLGYMVYGQTEQNDEKEDGDKQVNNIIFFHGSPGSRLFFHPNHANLSKAKNFRVYVVERPGFGLSTPKEDATILGFSNDIEEFVGILKLRKFSIVGYSAGGPYALACGFALAELVYKVVIVSSVGPPDTPNIYDGMAPFLKFGWVMSKHWKGGLQRAVKSEDGKLKKNPVQKLRDDMKMYSEVDFTKYDSDTEIEKLFVESGLENCSRPDSLAAEAHAYMLFGQDWGFSPSNVGVPVIQFAGRLDRASVENIAKYLDESIRNCNTIFKDDKGHLMFFDIWDEILDAVMS